MAEATEARSEPMVTGLFADSESVERAFQAVVDRGYDQDDVNVVMSDDTRKRYFAEDREIKTELARKSAEGGELGGPTGGRIGLAISVLAAVGASLAIPALGLVAAGPIAVALAGAGAAGLAASLIGLLGDWGLPKERVECYEAGIHDGAILVGVKPRSQEDARQIARDWKALGGRDVYGG
jgi:hypothetical protein